MAKEDETQSISPTGIPSGEDFGIPKVVRQDLINVLKKRNYPITITLIILATVDFILGIYQFKPLNLLNLLHIVFLMFIIGLSLWLGEKSVDYIKVYKYPDKKSPLTTEKVQ